MNYRFGIDIPWLNGNAGLSNISREMATMRISVIYKLQFGLLWRNLLSERNFNIKTSVLI